MGSLRGDVLRSPLNNKQARPTFSSARCCHSRSEYKYLMAESPASVVEPRAAASVILVRDAKPGAPEPIEIYLIRRKRDMLLDHSQLKREEQEP